MTESPETPDSPFRTRGFVGSVVVLGLVAVAGLGLGAKAVFTGSSSPPAPAAVAGGLAGAGDSVCGLPAGDQSLPTAGPRARWELVGKVAVPTDRRVGPGIQSGGERRCFAHSPVGALFATVNFMALGSRHPADVEAIRKVVVDNPASRRLFASDTGGDSTGGFVAQVAGYQVLAATADAVTVRLGVRGNDGSTVAVTLSMVWDHGDWRVAVARESGLPYEIEVLDNLGGFIPWAGA